MSDDILTELREYADLFNAGGKEIFVDAADEIERLRTQRDYWHERNGRAEECISFYLKKKWWQR